MIDLWCGCYLFSILCDLAGDLREAAMMMLKMLLLVLLPSSDWARRIAKLNRMKPIVVAMMIALIARRLRDAVAPATKTTANFEPCYTQNAARRRIYIYIPLVWGFCVRHTSRVCVFCICTIILSIVGSDISLAKLGSAGAEMLRSRVDCWLVTENTDRAANGWFFERRRYVMVVSMREHVYIHISGSRPVVWTSWVVAHMC